MLAALKKYLAPEDIVYSYVTGFIILAPTILLPFVAYGEIETHFQGVSGYCISVKKLVRS